MDYKIDMASKGRSSKAMARVPTTPKVFHLFPALAPELQCMIIKHACFVPRNVSLFPKRQEHMVHGEGREQWVSFTHSYHTTSQPPSILQVSQEVRTEALRWYSLSFGTNLRHGNYTFTRPPKVYINWAVDCLCFLQPEFMCGKQEYWIETPLLEVCQQNKLNTLALKVPYNLYRINYSTKLRASNIKNLILCQNHKYDEKESDFELEPFQKTNKNGSLSKKILSPATYKRINEVKENLVKAWDEEDEKNAWKSKYDPPPSRPSIELARFVAI